MILGQSIAFQSNGHKVIVNGFLDEYGRVELRISDPTDSVQVFVNGKDWTRD